MTTINSILSMTDFSPDARYAAERAAMLGAANTVEKGVLLHVLEKTWLDTLKHLMKTSEDTERQIVDETSEILTGWANEIRDLSGFSFTPQVHSGDVLDTLVQAALDFDLIVLGARGRHPVRALAMGTTSQRILSKVRKPVLIVKHKPKKSYQRVLVATDFSLNSFKGLQYIPAIAPECDIYLVHVFEAMFERRMISAGVSNELLEEYRTEAKLKAESEMTRFISQAQVDRHQITRFIEHGHVQAKVPEIIAKLTPDLVVVGKHGRTRIEEFLLGSVTLHVLAQSPCDVFVAE